MSLEPCKVCGVLNSSEEEICLSCGYPTKGRKRPIIFKITAIIVVLALLLPLIITLFNLIKPQQKPQPSTTTKTSLTLFIIFPNL
ncbi:hypothetical protein IQ247_06345 [Plectonema cf. radiosum LEGE 06105]|uniref:Uncharacterized protein n=1 Tax=Plectonema cf. radiosum LEGE 06105 TaxID=945769 RepID=A0A8J7F369_9CYAN|nr:hypothetical protein [Plectonema radiosum]MBE9212330.1 hypothetical protein [Plectonema cf. radiosum LEGE 06105]